jgi:hypothetical protein
MSKALMLALAVMLVFAFSFPAFAQDYFTTTSGSYIQESEGSYATSTTIYVNLVVESRQISGNNLYRTVSNIALNPGGVSQTFDVRDALLAVQGTNGLLFKDSSGNNIDISDDYVYSIVDTTPDPDRTYAPTSPSAWNGWMFRIDGQFPLEDDNPVWGASISTAYLTNGDTIHFYHDDPSSSSASAKYAKITSITDNDSNSLTVNVKASTNYFPPPNYNWVINNFANCQGLTVKAYIVGQSTPAATGTTDASGNVTLNVGSFGSNQYKVEVVREYFENEEYNNGLIMNTYDVVASYDP